MQVTIEIDDDVLAAVRELAESQEKSPGEVLSDLAREALRSDRDFDEGEDRGFPVFRVSVYAPPLTEEMVRRALWRSLRPPAAPPAGPAAQSCPDTGSSEEGGAAGHRWTGDGRAFLVTRASGVRTDLVRLDAETGEITPLTDAGGTVARVR